MTDPAAFKLPVLAVSVAALWLAEGLAPHFASFVRDVRARRVHALRNVALAVINGVLGVAVLGALIAGSAALTRPPGRIIKLITVQKILDEQHTQKM